MKRLTTCGSEFDISDAPFDLIHRRYQASQLRSFQTDALAEWLRTEEREIKKVCLEENVYSVLNIGTGLGRIERLLASAVDRIIGIELYEDVLEYTKGKLKDEGYYNRFELNIGDASDMKNIPDNTLDLVISAFNTLGVMPETTEQKVISEAYRVLRPNGLFLNSVWADSALEAQRELYDQLRRQSQNMFWKTEVHSDRMFCDEAFCSRRYSKEHLIKLLSDRFDTQIIPLTKSGLMAIARKLKTQT